MEDTTYVRHKRAIVFHSQSGIFREYLRQEKKGYRAAHDINCDFRKSDENCLWCKITLLHRI